MWCPNCQSEKTKVIGTDKSHVVERFRRCEDCGYTFPTIETHKFDAKWQENAQYSEEEAQRIIKKSTASKHGQADFISNR